jgi:hypothetical protein
MTTLDGNQMFLSAEAETVCRALVDLGAEPESGYRNRYDQANAMASNIVESGNRQWIEHTYLWPGSLQKLVDSRPDATDEDELRQLLLDGLDNMTDEEFGRLSHHTHMPCDVFDLMPSSVNEEVRTAIRNFQHNGQIVKVLWLEGGLIRCHVECASLPLNKVVQV